MWYKSINFHHVFQTSCAIVLLLIANICFASPALSNTKPARVSLELSQVSLRDVFRSLEKESDYVFFYSDEVKSELNQVVNARFSSETVEQVLASVLKNTNLTYKLNDRQVIISRKAEETAQVKKNILVNGTVLDAQHGELPGVSVTIKDSNVGTTTDIDGHFSIEVPDERAVLLFRYTGYESQEIKVGKQININVNMKENSTGLNEVVVVGYGSQRRVSVVGAITTIEPKRLQESPTRALSNNLAGQLAGIIAVQRTGEPGVDGSNFWIRGISSFQNAGRDPLVLVDGIERTLDDMDPAEIESFSVLKDASASAVYGVRGANGVILITTKRGHMGKPAVNVHYEQSFTQPVKLPKYIGSADYLTLLDELIIDDKGDPLYTQDVLDQYRNGTDLDLYPSVNWLDAVTKDHASNQRVNLTVNGGSEFLRYAFVASYYGEQGIFERDKSQTWNSGTGLKKYNMRSNVDFNITKLTVARINIGGYLQDTNGMAVSSDDIFNRAFETTPFAHPAIYSSGELPRVKGRDNPWALATQHGFTTYSSSKVESLFSLEQDLKFMLPGLKIKGIFSFDRWSKSGIKRSKDPQYYNPVTTRDDDGNLNLIYENNGQEFLGTEKKMEWGNSATYFEANLNYSRDFGQHHVEGMFLYNQRDYQNGDAQPFRRQGIAGRASYMFDNRYIAELNFGYNGSENFAPGYRYGFFPSVAVGYLLSEAEFMQPYRHLFSKVKFRGSWGKTGNDQFAGSRFAYITEIKEEGSYKWGVNNDYNRSGRLEGKFGIPDLTWETVEKVNVGMEIGLWQALDFQFDVFKDYRSKIFMQRNTIPTAAGFTEAPWANFGKVSNQGFDMSLTFNKQFNRDWAAGFHGSFTYAKNKIEEKDEAPGVLGTNRSVTGLPVNQLFGLIAERLFTEDDFEDVENGKLKEGIPSQAFTQVRPGDIKYKDMDGDNVITTMDIAPVGGTYDPQIVYGFGASASYKNMDLNLFFQGNANTWRFIGGSYFLPGSTMGTMGNILDNYNDRWTPENPRQDVFYPRLKYGPNENNTQNSTWWLRNMSMLRMRDIEVGYRFPKQWVGKIGLTSARLYMKGSNLLTFSDFKLWDPEVDTPNGAKYPIMKAFSFGFDVNF